MAPYPEFDADDLGDFVGKPAEMFPAYVDEAIAQAVFLVRLRTKIRQWPEDDEDLSQLMKFAILDLANTMYLEREYDKIKANPVQSETMGSYSWSKSNAAQNSRYKQWPTGIEWLDVLLEYLADLDEEAEGISTHGGTHVFEYDNTYLDSSGERWALGPERIIDNHRRRGSWR
jgi:hypothetical protein